MYSPSYLRPSGHVKNPWPCILLFCHVPLYSRPSAQLYTPIWKKQEKTTICQLGLETYHSLRCCCLWISRSKCSDQPMWSSPGHAYGLPRSHLHSLHHRARSLAPTHAVYLPSNHLGTWRRRDDYKFLFRVLCHLSIIHHKRHHLRGSVYRCRWPYYLPSSPRKVSHRAISECLDLGVFAYLSATHPRTAPHSRGTLASASHADLTFIHTRRHRN